MSRTSLRSNWPSAIPTENMRTRRASREWRPSAKRHEQTELGPRPAELNVGSASVEQAWSYQFSSWELDEVRPAVLGRRERTCPECRLVLLPSGACGSC